MNRPPQPISALPLVFLLISCPTFSAQQSQLDPDTTVAMFNSETGTAFTCGKPPRYIPLPEMPVPNYSLTETDKDGNVTSKPQAWPTNMEARRKLLPNIASEVTTQTRSTDGNVGLPGIFSADGNRIKKLYTIDMIKYRMEPIIDKATKKVLMFATVGVGLRLKIDIETNDRKFEFGNLINLAFKAKQGSVSGTISAHVIGMDSNDINVAMPFSNDISDSSIQKMIEAMAIVRAKFNDPNTTLAPQMLAQVACPD